MENKEYQLKEVKNGKMKEKIWKGLRSNRGEKNEGRRRGRVDESKKGRLKK